MFSGGRNRFTKGKKDADHQLTQLNDSLRNWVVSKLPEGRSVVELANVRAPSAWQNIYKTLRNNTGGMVDKMLYQELDVAQALTNKDAPNTAQAMGGFAKVGELLHDIDRYIGIAEQSITDENAGSIVMARLMREYLQEQVNISIVTQKTPPKNREKVIDGLNEDFAKLQTKQQWIEFIDKHHSLATTMQAMALTFEEGSFQRKVAEFMANHARTNDIYISTLPRSEMDGSAGYYNFSNGTITVSQGPDIDTLFATIMHEATHVYTTRMTIRYRNYLADQKPNQNVHYSEYGLNAAEVRFLQHADNILKLVQNEPIREQDMFKFGRLRWNNTNVPYGASVTQYKHTDLAEFFAELYSNKTFREWVEDTIIRKENTSKRNAKNKLRELVEAFLNMFKVDTSQDNGKALEQFLEFGFRYWDNSAWVTSSPRLKLIHKKSARKSQGKGFNNSKDARSRAEYDFESGVRYYTFKRVKAFGNPELAGSARYDEENGWWEFQWADEDGTVHTKKDLNIADVMELALANDMNVYGRSTLDGYGHWLDGQIEKVKMTNPAMGRMLEKLRFFLMNFVSEDTANNWVGKLYETSLWAEQYFMNRDALHIWLERALREQGRDPESAAKILNDIQAKTQTFLNERGLTEMSFHDHKVAVMELANQYNITHQEFNDIVYALTAKYRKELFDKEPGEINPYTGKPVRDGSLVSGFEWKDANGNIVKDDDGSKYLGQLPPEKLQFAELLVEKWIDQNNAVLDFEYQAGAISKAQYEAQYGLFYAPLRNIDDQASAFYKRALGRVTKAQDPATNYYNFAQARISYAQHQMKMSALLNTALTENVQSIIEVNQAHFTQDGTGLKKAWKSGNKQDPALITVWKGNTQYQMRITDPTIAQFIRKADEREMTGFYQLLSTVTRALSTVRTSLSTTFVPAAFARDILTAIGNVEAAFANLGSASLQPHESRALSGRVPKRAVQAAVEILGGTLRGQRRWEYDVFKRAGGGITMNARYDFEQVNDWLKAELRPARQNSSTQLGTGLRKAKSGIRTAMEFSHAFEDAVRFATFMEYLEMKNGGRKFQSEQELITFLQNNQSLKSAAVTGSKRITGNFEVKGSNVGFRSAFMFFNASMVGLSTAVNMFNPRHGTHGLKFAMAMAGMMLASVALVDADLGDDEDGKTKAHRVRELGDKLCYGGVCVQIPHEVRFVTNPVTAAYFLAKGDISLGDAVARTMHGALQVGSPFQFDGFSTSGNQMHTLLQNLVPTMLELPVQLATGYNGFGKHINAEHAYTANGQRIINAMDWQKTKMSDPEWTKWLAMNGQKWLGLDVSSSEIDHTTQFMLGSVYTTLKKGGSAIMNGGTPSDVLHAVFGRGFSMNYDDSAMRNEMKERIRQEKARLTMGADTANMLVSSDELKANPQYARLVALEKEIEKAEKSLTFNGKSYSELFRQKQHGILSNDIDSILEANEGIDELSERRREIWGEFWEDLDELTRYQ